MGDSKVMRVWLWLPFPQWHVHKSIAWRVQGSWFGCPTHWCRDSWDTCWPVGTMGRIGRIGRIGKMGRIGRMRTLQDSRIVSVSSSNGCVSRYRTGCLTVYARTWSRCIAEYYVMLCDCGLSFGVGWGSGLFFGVGWGSGLFFGVEWGSGLFFGVGWGSGLFFVVDIPW